MRWIPIALCFLAANAAPVYAAYEDADDWALFSRVLALVQPIVHLAATSPDPQAAQKAIDAMLAGRDARANRIALQLLDEALADVPPEHRPIVRSIGRDMLLLARRQHQQARTADASSDATERAIRARKELHAMGLRYWDEQQFQDAVKRGDAIAVELFLAARGARSLPEAR
jgi:hypothetical protein